MGKPLPLSIWKYSRKTCEKVIQKEIDRIERLNYEQLKLLYMKLTNRAYNDDKEYDDEEAYIEVVRIGVFIKDREKQT